VYYYVLLGDHSVQHQPLLSATGHHKGHVGSLNLRNQQAVHTDVQCVVQEVC